MIIPILKDTIEDYKKTFHKMFIIILTLIVALVGVIAYCGYLVSNSNERYAEFLSQFEFESGEEYVQEIDSSDNSSAVINDGININK